MVEVVEEEEEEEEEESGEEREDVKGSVSMAERVQPSFHRLCRSR